jgi:glycerol uptake facilitator-like aquaporin
VLNSTDANNKTSDHAGVAIGFTLAFAILMGGPLTGGSLNPARTLGPAIAADIYDDLWVYFAGPALGGLAAAALWRYFLRNKPRRAH